MHYEDVDAVFLVWLAPLAAAPGALERIAAHCRAPRAAHVST
jgi:hypothetical protein